jgi:RHS repeat-associated protein
VDIQGISFATNSVTVNSQTAYRKGEFFRKELAVNNASASLWTNMVVAASGQTSVTGNLFVANSPETFGYDADGNMTNDGRWALTWDAENRLTQAESLSSGPTASKRKVVWEFDAKGRRVRQTTSDGSSGSYVVTEDLKFLSDGWRHIAELNATNNALMRSYVWGLDLSGSLNGAGGVGGLLMLNSVANGMHFYAYDGNGNVTALVKGSDGTVSANYEYDPFGSVLRTTGAMANENRFQFSAKRCDRTTDFKLYEYRVLNFCWLSRDPIEEQGFFVATFSEHSTPKLGNQRDRLNAYAFAQNNPVVFSDRLGLESCPALVCGPDVTRPLGGLILKLYSTWNAVWTPTQRRAACDGLTSWDRDPIRGFPAWLNAWDIDRLWRGNQAWINARPYCPPCATQPACRNTVEVGNQCYYAGSANYVLFGHMSSLCGWPKWQMTFLIWSYKRNSPNYVTSRDWAIAGYDGWPAGSASQPAGDRSQCSPVCPVVYSGPAFRFYWYPHGWN